MPSIILSDNGVSSGNAGLKSTAASDGALALQTTTSGGAATTAVTIDTSQRVGIGTTSPNRPLEVYSSSATPLLRLNNTPGGGNNGIELIYSSVSKSWLIGAGYNVGGALEFTRSTTNGGTTFTTPDVVIDTGQVKNTCPDNTKVSLSTIHSGTVPQGMQVTYTAASPNNSGTGSTFLYCVDSSAVRAYISGNGGLNNYSANNTNLASDYRLKHAIEPVKSYWNVFKAIEWKTWLYNDQTDEIKNIGVIAQELQALAPELVCESGAFPTPEGESPYLGLWENDFKMAAMSVITELVKKSEEQQALIDTLTTRLTALENK